MFKNLKKIFAFILTFAFFLSLPLQTLAFEGEVEKKIYNLEGYNVGTFKSYMDYRAITAVGSKQYELQEVAYTGMYGIRMIGDRYLVAVAETFGQAGDEIEIVLEDGSVLPCIIGDIKAYTDLLGGDGSLVEFIVDTDYIPDEVSLMGSFGVIFPGYVASVKY